MVHTSGTETIQYSELSELKTVAQKIISYGSDLNIWLFEGEMGAGKTTLIRTIGECMGVEDNITSPTFSLVNEYESENGKSIYHFDFYRLKNETEALDIGVEDYFYSGNYCFIEWPSKIQSLLPDHHLLIKITLENGKRVIELIKKQ